MATSIMEEPNSQESDYFPDEVKQILNIPEMQDVIKSVESEDPYQQFCILETEGSEYKVYSASVMNQNQQAPSPTCSMPCKSDYPGPCEFEVQVNSENSGNKWVFSHKLNKLFITMNTVIHLSFRCSTFLEGSFLRALPVFSECNDFQEPVVSCPIHQNSKQGVSQLVQSHIIRIEHPDAIYEHDSSSGRNSVRVLLDTPQVGTDWVNIAIQFTCKNSCLGGMNRRPIEVIFTLEDSRAAVYGRQTLKARICSCPKRDKRKEEEDLTKTKEKQPGPGKRVITPASNGIAKKCRLQHENTKQLTVPTSEYLEAVFSMYSRIKWKLLHEKRQPKEWEAALLNEYEQELSQQAD